MAALPDLLPWPQDGLQVHGTRPPGTEAGCSMLLSCSAAPTALQGHVRVFPAEQESSVILAAFYVANIPSRLVVFQFILSEELFRVSILTDFCCG